MVMRTGSWDKLSRGQGGRIRRDARIKSARKSRHRWIDLEGLETRTLLATDPVATTAGALQSLTNLQSTTTDGNTNSPAVAIDPYDSQKLFAVWGLDLSSLSPEPFTHALVDYSYSTDGGTHWSVPVNVGPVLTDAATIDGMPPTPYTEVTNPSVAFDSQGNVYVLTMQSTGNSQNASVTDGALVLNKFNFSGATPQRQFLPVIGTGSGVVYQWVPGADAVNNPILAVDAGTYPNSSPSSTPPAGVNQDIYANNVYIAWASGDVEPANPNPYNGPGYNPNRAELLASSDGGQTYSGETIANVDALPFLPNSGAQRDSHPQLAIVPGNASNPGQVTVAWEDFGTNATASPVPYSSLLSNIIQPGYSYGFFGPGLPVATASNGTSTTQGNWSAATIYNAGPNTSVKYDPTSISTADVSGDNKIDIVVSDNNSANGGVGVLLNTGTAGAGLFPANATIYPAGNSPSSVVLGNFTQHATATTLDAAVANDTSPGFVSVLTNNAAGVFGAPNPTGAGNGTVAVAQGNFDGSGATIVALNKADHSITIIPPASTGVMPFTLTSSLTNPTALVVDDFNGDGRPDIAVLNGNNTIQFFLDASTGAKDFTFTSVAPIGGLPPGIVAMASGHVAGNALTPPPADLIVASATSDAVYVLPNVSRLAATRSTLVFLNSSATSAARQPPWRPALSVAAAIIRNFRILPWHTRQRAAMKARSPSSKISEPPPISRSR